MLIFTVRKTEKLIWKFCQHILPPSRKIFALTIVSVTFVSFRHLTPLFVAYFNVLPLRWGLWSVYNGIRSLICVTSGHHSPHVTTSETSHQSKMAAMMVSSHSYQPGRQGQIFDTSYGWSNHTLTPRVVRKLLELRSIQLSTYRNFWAQSMIN